MNQAFNVQHARKRSSQSKERWSGSDEIFWCIDIRYYALQQVSFYLQLSKLLMSWSNVQSCDSSNFDIRIQIDWYWGKTRSVCASSQSLHTIAALIKWINTRTISWGTRYSWYRSIEYSAAHLGFQTQSGSRSGDNLWKCIPFKQRWD